MKRHHLLGVLLGGALFGGCGPTDGKDVGGTDVGNGRTVTLSLQGYETAPPDGTRSLKLSSGVTLDEVWIAVDRIRLEPLSSCDTDVGEIDVSGPILAELIGKKQLGASSFVTFDDQFCRVRIGFHDIDLDEAPAGTPAALDDLSILVTGQRADGVPFAVRSDLRDRIDLTALGGGFALSDDVQTLLVAYELGGWIDALDLDSLAGPSIVIDEDQNDDRLDAFEEAVKISAELYDDDDDGAIDAGDDLLAQ